MKCILWGFFNDTGPSNEVHPPDGMGGARLCGVDLSTQLLRRLGDNKTLLHWGMFVCARIQWRHWSRGQFCTEKRRETIRFDDVRSKIGCKDEVAKNARHLRRVSFNGHSVEAFKEITSPRIGCSRSSFQRRP
mmetsp:Transcript_70717/g.188774  ORF Transcript_70717/g.188774 Transcript_70717/m.188774 type:complete len:133 (+) Transcript_70717:147-545(+)